MSDEMALDARVRQLAEMFPVRKTAVQKQRFREALLKMLQQVGWQAEVEQEGRLIQSSNLVVGDVATAKLVLTAHYDTPARMPLPNFIAPQNLLATVLFQLLLVPLFFGVSWAASRLVFLAGGGIWLALLVTVVLMLLLVGLLLAGPANPHNANDNTSGVLVLLETALALPETLRGQVALVFFDNEEKGLLGSAAFAKRHGRLTGVPLVNFDCVGNGDTFLFLLPKVLRKDQAFARQLQESFGATADKQVLVDASPLTLYPSDQMSFARGVGVAALCKAPLVGYYLPHLHTARDTVCQEENIILLQKGSVRLAQLLAAPSAAEELPG